MTGHLCAAQNQVQSASGVGVGHWQMRKLLQALRKRDALRYEISDVDEGVRWQELEGTGYAHGGMRPKGGG